MNTEQTFNKSIQKHIAECSEVAYDQIKSQKGYQKLRLGVTLVETETKLKLQINSAGIRDLV